MRASVSRRDDDIINTLLGRTTPERLNAFARAPRSGPAGRRARRNTEVVVGRGGLAAGIPAIDPTLEYLFGGGK